MEYLRYERFEIFRSKIFPSSAFFVTLSAGIHWRSVAENYQRRKYPSDPINFLARAAIPGVETTRGAGISDHLWKLRARAFRHTRVVRRRSL